MSKRPATDQPQSSSKSAKLTSSSVKPAPATASFFTLRKAGQAFPALKPNPLNFPAKQNEGNIKISCWNVRSCRDCNSEKKGRALRKYVEAEDPDILILAEVKWPDAETNQELEWIRPRYAHRSFTGYTAVLSKIKPVKVTKGLPDWQTSDPKETESRSITFEFENSFVIAAYVQNSGENQKFMSKRMAWNADFRRYVDSLQPIKPVIFGGDWNVVSDKIDLERPDKNWDINPGARIQERTAHIKLLKEAEMVDVWRELHPTQREFTHTSARYRAWRIDGLIVSSALMERMVSSDIRHDVFKEFPNASDHWPVVTELKGPL